MVNIRYLFISGYISRVPYVKYTLSTLKLGTHTVNSSLSGLQCPLIHHRIKIRKGISWVVTVESQRGFKILRFLPIENNAPTIFTLLNPSEALDGLTDETAPLQPEEHK